MKKLILLFIILFPSISFSQEDFKTQVLIKDTFFIKENVYFGINKNATDLLDNNTEIGEYEVPSLSAMTDLGAGFIIQKVSMYDSTQLQDIYSYKDIRPYFKSDKDSIVYNMVIVYPLSEITMLFGKIPSFVKSAKLIQKYFPNDTFDILSNKMVKIPYNGALVTLMFDIVIKNYDDSGDVAEDCADIIISPNPAGNIINLRNNMTDGILNDEVIFIDMSGKIISKKLINGKIDISDLTKGNYILTLKDSKNKTFRKKITKI